MAAVTDRPPAKCNGLRILHTPRHPVPARPSSSALPARLTALGLAPGRKGPLSGTPTRRSVGRDGSKTADPVSKDGRLQIVHRRPKAEVLLSARYGRSRGFMPLLLMRRIFSERRSGVSVSATIFSDHRSQLIHRKPGAARMDQRWRARERN
jgi:hypothetical protein